MVVHQGDFFSLICRRPFPVLHRQFSELVDSISDQIVSYHETIILTVILQDTHSHNWTDHRPFFEVTWSSPLSFMLLLFTSVAFLV